MSKSRNGEGKTPGFYVGLDETRAEHVRALRYARRLAQTRHGLRQELMVMFLNALEDLEKQTGRIPSPEAISGALIANAMSGAGRAVVQMPSLAAEPTHVEIAIASAEKVDAKVQDQNFKAGIKARFANR